MRSIKSFIQAYKVNHTFRLFVNLLLAVIIIYILAIITTTKAHNSELNDLKRANKQTIKESERVIIEQQKEIDKLKKDVVLHTIIADSSIAKANRISKKTILNQQYALTNIFYGKIWWVINNHKTNISFLKLFRIRFVSRKGASHTLDKFILKSSLFYSIDFKHQMFI